MVLVEESLQSRTVKFLGEHFFRHSFAKKLDITCLRRSDVKEPSLQQISPCTYAYIEDEYFDIIRLMPQKCNPQKVVLYVHGGAFVSGPTMLHWNMLAKLADTTEFAIYVPNYRLAPEFNFWEGSKDILTTYERIQKAHPYAEIIFMGDSAGGSLALSIAMQLRDRALPLPSKMVLISPWLDLAFNNPLMDDIESEDAFLAKEGLREAVLLWKPISVPIDFPYLSPIYGTLEGLPPCMLQVGTHDMLCPDAREFRKKAKNEGLSLSYVEVPHMFHAWTTHIPFIPEANKALEKAIRFIQ